MQRSLFNLIWTHINSKDSMLVFGLLFIFVCGVAYVHILNNKSVQSGNPSNPYLVEDDGIYEDDTYRSHFSEEERYWAGTVIIYAFSLSRSCRKCSENYSPPINEKSHPSRTANLQLLTLNLIPWKTRCKYRGFMLYSMLLRHKSFML